MPNYGYTSALITAVAQLDPGTVVTPHTFPEIPLAGATSALVRLCERGLVDRQARGVYRVTTAGGRRQARQVPVRPVSPAPKAAILRADPRSLSSPLPVGESRILNIVGALDGGDMIAIDDETSRAYRVSLL